MRKRRRTRRRTRYMEATPVVPLSDTKTRKCTAKGKRKCRRGLWDLTIPTDLLQEILSRLGLKANIQASLVCKSWFQSAVSVRNFKPCPWLFSPTTKGRSPTESPYILANPLQSQSQTYELDFPELIKYANIFCSKDGWVLVRSHSHKSGLFLNPFTNNRFYLPKSKYNYSGTLAFSAAPTSTSCLVISCTRLHSKPYVVISTWRPGQATWTVHRFGNSTIHHRRWERCVFSNGLFYTLSECGYLGVFDPYQTTWDIVPVKSCMTVSPKFYMAMLMAEHEGDIFVVHTRNYKRPIMLKLNLEQNVWEEKTDLGGLTVFASLPTTYIRAGLSEEERNKIYPSFTTTHELHGMYYSLGDGRSSHSSYGAQFYSNVAWVEPPKNLNLL